jgi:hypothetical protein
MNEGPLQIGAEVSIVRKHVNLSECTVWRVRTSRTGRGLDGGFPICTVLPAVRLTAGRLLTFTAGVPVMPTFPVTGKGIGPVNSTAVTGRAGCAAA